LASIQGIYLALFNRPADPAGLAFWTEHTKGGTDLSFLVGRLTAEPEYLLRFAGMDNSEIINSIYQSLFGRDAEPAGLTHYLGQLAAGEASIETIAIAILDGAQGSDRTLIAEKIEAADLFTTHLDTALERAAYVGEDAAQIGREYIEAINLLDPASPEKADAAILRLFDPDEGQTPGGGGNGGSNDVPPMPTGDAQYGDADILVLEGKTIIKSYDPETEEELDAALEDVQIVADEREASNTVLIQSEELLGGRFGGWIEEFSYYAESIFGEGLDDWAPDAAFFNGALIDRDFGDTAVTGTSGNDFAFVYQSEEFDHTVTGGRGRDLLVVYTQNQDLPARETFESDEGERELGSITIDGGADDDVILADGRGHTKLLGGDGDDLIYLGWDSTDTINGGTGNDVLIGGLDSGVSYDAPHFVFKIGEGDGTYRVNVEDITNSKVVCLDQGEATTTGLTFLGRLPDGSAIFRIDNGSTAEETMLTLKSGEDFTLDIPMPPEGVAVVNVGDLDGPFTLTGVEEAVVAGGNPLQLLSEVDFETGDVLTGGAGADAFVYEAESFINATSDDDWSVNGADTIMDFQTGEDQIVLYAYEYRGLEAGLEADKDGFYAEEEGFASFLEAALAAERANTRFFFAAGVNGDGYLFVDEYDDGSYDFAIRLKGLTSLEQFGEGDISVPTDAPDILGIRPELLESLAAA
jgi:Ca2+-binding RTX toxin-like protein